MAAACPTEPDRAVSGCSALFAPGKVFDVIPDSLSRHASRWPISDFESLEDFNTSIVV
jgi:hypothetical protein